MSYLLFIILALIVIGIGETLRERHQEKKSRIKRKEYPLSRHPKNPLLTPHPYNNWESECAFNPAVFMDDEGKVHLLYRAIGGDGQSRIGYAGSDDGIHFSDRLAYPVYEPIRFSSLPYGKERTYDPVMYPSGGSWGGYEDPRAVEIDGRVYVTYIDFGGWNSIRIALTSIAVSDLKKKKWNWKRPMFISPEGERHKNWVLFPEKINGKYAIFHGIAPEIYVDYVDDLSLPFTIQSPRPEGPQKGREDFWDNRLRGAGPPPVKTKLGWLLLYHALDNEEPHKYKIGAMILDLNNPKKVLYRSPEPILTPEMNYENDGKPGIVYASGAIVIKGNLYVYYGGGDKNVCLARTPINPLLDWLVTYGKQ